MPPTKAVRAIDHDELLVMGAAGDRIVVEDEPEARVGHPIEVDTLHPLPLEREHDVEVPGEYVDVELRVRVAEPVQEWKQTHLCIGWRVVATKERDAAVELPA
jgi:hypothetical protein